MTTNKIEAQMTPDWVEPYSKMGQKIPVVTESNHPRFQAGVRLDWGFVQVALRDGFQVNIKPLVSATSSSTTKDGES